MYKIKGIEMFNFELISVQYADDIWVTLCPLQDSLNELIEEMYRFYTFSGLEVNYSKTVGYKLGSCRDIDAQHYLMKKINWSDKYTKILGIWYHPNSLLMHKYNLWTNLKKCISYTTLGKHTISHLWEKSP